METMDGDLSQVWKMEKIMVIMITRDTPTQVTLSFARAMMPMSPQNRLSKFLEKPRTVYISST